MALDKLEEFQGELKTLTKDDAIRLRKGIEKHGYTFPAAVWKNKILDGHQRTRVLREMEKEGWTIPKLPVVEIEAKSEKDAREKLLAAASQYGTMAKKGLAEFMGLADLSLEDLVGSFRFPEINFDRFKNEFFPAEEEEGENDIPELPKKAKTKAGELYQLGDHKLMCGDSTDKFDLNRLMGDTKACITFTSPPYNLGNNAKLRGYNADGDDSAYNEKTDHKEQAEYLSFLNKFTAQALTHSKVVFVNIQMLAGNKLIFPDYWAGHSEKMIDVMIWDKEHAAPAMPKRVLNSVFEFIFIMTNSKNPTRAIPTGKEFRGTIENIYRLSPIGKKDKLAKDHGAVFPVQFAEYFVTQFADHAVLDLFGGSGTTMIAAEKSKKKCFMMEMDPLYCDVIIARWEAFTGKKALLLKAVRKT